MDWAEVLAMATENRQARLMAEILASQAYESTRDAARALVQKGGGCWATRVLITAYFL
jgi:hypothetical protein